MGIFNVFEFDTYSCLINLFSPVKNQFSKTIKTIRIDNGQEFISYKMQHSFHINRIFYEKTCVEIPQQNDVAERKH